MEAGIASVAACTGVTTLIIIVGFLASAHRKRNSRLALEAAFKGRRPQTVEELHNRSFAERGVPFFVTAGVLKVLASELETDVSRLYAEDDFAGNLKAVRAAIEDPSMMLSLEEVFEVTISESDAHEMGTKVEDLVSLVWATLKRKAANANGQTQ